ncbi:hypothetical protein BDW74DRAFT_160926 [Aspergillus multicolor]|uniref:uncharacterized protein n=1 Tax=Aspergillus multicolor TaxID=41759 RepID=UPI003CCD7520
MSSDPSSFDETLSRFALMVLDEVDQSLEQQPTDPPADISSPDASEELHDSPLKEEEGEQENFFQRMLKWAAKEGYLEVVELLLARPDVHPDGKRESSPLDEAEREGHDVIVEILLKHCGGNWNEGDYAPPLLSGCFLQSVA